MQSPRRSPRLASKPKVNYITDDDIILQIQDMCDKYGIEYSDHLLVEYKRDITVNPRLAENTMFWYYSSKTLQRLARNKNLEKAFIRYCNNSSISFDSTQLAEFLKWEADPANKDDVYIKDYEEINNKTYYLCPKYPSQCVKKWFSLEKVKKEREQLENEKADENYNNLQKALEELKTLQARLANIKAKCWAVYVHDFYESNDGVQGTRLFYLTDTPTEKEARDYVEKHRKLSHDYVIIPATKNGNGKITDCEGYDITHKIARYDGPCKVLFASVDWFLEDNYEGRDIPERNWIDASNVVGRHECEPAEIVIYNYFNKKSYFNDKIYFDICYEK